MGRAISPRRAVGAGTYGTVFRAMDTQLGRAVALKLAWPGILIDSASSRRFAQEPETVAYFSHPGIVEVFESGNFELAWYIALELIGGPAWRDRSKARIMCPRRTSQ